MRLTDSVVGVHKVSCSTARGIFLGQGSNLCLLHWQVDSYPLKASREVPPSPTPLSLSLSLSLYIYMHQRADTLKPYSQKTSQSNHSRTTALSNSMKLSHAHGATQDGGPWWRDLTECGPLEKGMANHFTFLALRTP